MEGGEFSAAPSRVTKASARGKDPWLGVVAVGLEPGTLLDADPPPAG